MGCRGFVGAGMRLVFFPSHFFFLFSFFFSFLFFVLGGERDGVHSERIGFADVMYVSTVRFDAGRWLVLDL